MVSQSRAREEPRAIGNGAMLISEEPTCDLLAWLSLNFVQECFRPLLRAFIAGVAIDSFHNSLCS